MKQHKWHKEIKAWADGAEIEARILHSLIDSDAWHKWDTPSWNSNDYEFRIKPQPKEPQYLYVYEDKILINKKIENEGVRFVQYKLKNTKWKYIGKIKLEVDD